MVMQQHTWVYSWKAGWLLWTTWTYRCDTGNSGDCKL